MCECVSVYMFLRMTSCQLSQCLHTLYIYMYVLYKIMYARTCMCVCTFLYTCIYMYTRVHVLSPTLCSSYDYPSQPVCVYLKLNIIVACVLTPSSLWFFLCEVNFCYKANVHVHVCCVALPCCLFDLACFFLTSFLLISH